MAGILAGAGAVKAFNAFVCGQTLRTLKLELEGDFPQFVEPSQVFMPHAAQ